jgi:FAD/FMN-containing dehydrogenase
VEALDRSFLDFVREAGRQEARSLPAETEAILILEVEGETPAAAAAELDRLERDLVRGGLARGMIRGLDGESRRRLWEIRKAASPILAARGAGRRSTRFIEDACVPAERLPRFLREIRRFLAENRLDAAIFGHAGDAILHVNPFLDPSDPDIGPRMERIAAEYAESVLFLGGSLSGEHGDGRLRTPFLGRAFGAVAGILREVKELFDPAGILNPGIKVHDGRSRMWDHLDLGPRRSAFALPAGIEEMT